MRCRSAMMSAMRTTRTSSTYIIAACGLAAILAVASVGQAAPGKPASVEKLTSVNGITEYRLKNGLRVLLFPDSSKPTITVNITYFVGSRHEGYGESGMAHLLEHMLFKGTPKHPKLWSELQDHGAQFNGTTWTDRTNYFETLPAVPGNLEWALGMEADRMVHSKIANEDLQKEFSVVRNEFEMGENSPADVLEERIYSTAYLWHGYGRSTIGSRSDIERVPIDNLRTFYTRFYQPDNAMLVIAGKFETNSALELVAKHFGSLAKPARKLPNTYTVEPVQDGERSVVLRRTGDVSLVSIAYHGLAGGDPDFVAEQALVEVLANKPAGRLYKALVEAGLVAEVSGTAYVWAEPGLLRLAAKVRADGNPESVRDRMIEVIEGLAQGKSPITDEELKRFQMAMRKRFELLMTQSDRIGVELSEWAALGDWRMMFMHRDRVEALTKEQVQSFAARFVKPANRTVGLFLPTKAPDRSPLPAMPDVAAMVKDYKGSAPVEEGEAFDASLDNIEKRTVVSVLPGGAKLALLPKKNRGKAVRILLSVRTGSLETLKGRQTAASLVGAMLQRGTAKHSYQELRDELDRLKAEVRISGEDGQGAPDQTTLRITTVRDNLAQVMKLVAEMLRQPSFPAAEFTVIKRNVLAQLEEAQMDPQALLMTRIARYFSPYPADDVRYVPTIAERIARVQALKLEEVQAVWRELWGGQAANLVAIGDFDAKELQAQATEILSGWTAQKPYARVPRPFFAGIAGLEEEIQTNDKEMAMVAAAHNVELREDDPAYPALVLGNFVLGGSARSLLLERLRQQEGLSYGAFSMVSADVFDKNGTVLAGAICAPQNAKKAMASLLDEVGKFARGGISDKELREAKAAFKLSYENRLAQDDFLLGLIERNLYAGRNFAFQKKQLGTVQALSASELAAALKKFIEPARLAKIRAGDFRPQPGK